MRIIGIYPQKIELNIKLDPDSEEPLGLGYILATAIKKDHDIETFIPNDEDDLHLSKQIVDCKPDIVAFSALTKHIPRTIDLTSKIKQISPQIRVVVGGPGLSLSPEVVEQTDIDFCVIGEGEATFSELLDVLENNGDPTVIEGLAYKDTDGRFILNKQRHRIDNLDNLPRPVRFTEFYSVNGYGLNYPSSSNMVYAPMIFSRGCSLACSFCDSPALWGKTVRYRSPDDTVSEMLFLRDTYGVSHVFFEDLTFTLNKTRTIELCKEMQRRKTEVFWACETRADMADADLLSKMNQAGCSKIAWGIESLNENTLRHIRKSLNPTQIEKTLRISSDIGIMNWAFYIIGFPWESEKDILDATGSLSNLSIHQLRISIATPFPGSQWHKEIPESALHPDLSLYDTNHLVYDHPTISPERMKELQNEVFVRFYRSPKYHERVVKMTKKFPHLRESFDEFLAYIDSQIELLETGRTDITQVYTLDEFAGRKVTT